MADQDLFECPVCKEIAVEPMVGSCGHTICKLCQKALPRSQWPECRRMTKFRPNFMLGKFIRKQYPEAYAQKMKELFKFTEEGKFQEACKAFRVIDFKQCSYSKLDKIYILNQFEKHYRDPGAKTFPDGFGNTVTIVESSRPFHWSLSTEMKGFSYMRLNDVHWFIFSRGKKLPRQSPPIVLE